jgi:hypothetical protein
MHASTIRLAFALCGLGIAFPASAADIRSQLTPDLIYNHCQSAGVGSEIESTFMLPGGRRVTGSVLCTVEDLSASRAMGSKYDDGDDTRGGDHDDEDDHEDQGGDRDD